MKNKNNIIIGILLLIVFGLVAYLIFSAPIEEVKPFDESHFREEIIKQRALARHWEEEATTWQNTAYAAEAKADSLESLKPDIYEDHNDQFDFNINADDNQLDSVIRSNW